MLRRATVPRETRFTLLLQPSEKAELVRRAAAVGLSASEFVRRHVFNRDGSFGEGNAAEKGGSAPPAAR